MLCRPCFPEDSPVIDPGFVDGNIGGFAQAADDAREVIEFMHDRPLPLGYETAVPLCDAPDTDLIYDVSISDVSGLQVPMRMVVTQRGQGIHRDRCECGS